MEIKNLKLADLRLNPTNPREVVEEKYKQLIESILVFPKMLELRPVVHNARREVLGGNMRLRVLQDIAQMSLEDIKARLECLEGYRSKPQAERVALLEFWQRWLDSPYAPAASAEGLTDAEQQEFIIKDNLSFGKWDWEALANDWDEEQLGEWGLDVWQPKDLGLSTEGREGDEGYDEFTDKFKPKLTTDDCYTPQPIYEAVCEWVDKNIVRLAGYEIIRPFFPGGDYEHHHYPEGCIVIDNPPFSISAQILDFYLERDIPFFLFCNGLTSLGTGARREGVTTILIGEMIEFENGAKVNIGFFTNLCPKVRVWLASDLSKKITEIQTKPQDLALNKWDIHIQSAGLLGKIAKRVTVKIMADECEFISTLSDGSAIYGGGIVLSDRAAQRTEEERRKAEEERRKAEEERRKAEEERAVNRILGDKEREIIERLNRNSYGTI